MIVCHGIGTGGVPKHVDQSVYQKRIDGAAAGGQDLILDPELRAKLPSSYPGSRPSPFDWHRSLKPLSIRQNGIRNATNCRLVESFFLFP